MLTIKHIDTDGTETLMEAERVEKVRTGDRYNDGIYLDRKPIDCCGTGPQPPREFKHVILFRDASSQLVGGDPSTALAYDPFVYVMNRFGATVATYRL